MATASRSDHALTFVAAYLLIFTSGSIRFNANQDTFLLFAFLVGIALLVYKVRTVDLGFVLYCCGFLGFLLLIWGYTNGSLPITSVVGVGIKLITAYALVVFLRDLFVDRILQVIYFLALVSLIGFATDQFNILTPLITRLPEVGDASAYEGFLYAFRSQSNPGRNHSIFYEPGAYQLFLNGALYVLLFFKGDWEQKRRLKFVTVILIAIVTTQSTTAYLMAALILAVAFVKSNLISPRQKGALVVAGGLLASAFSTTFYDTIVVKINDYLDVQDITDTSNRRSSDLLADIEIIKRYPLGLGNEDYKLQFSAVGQIREGAGSSNGLTRMFAIYGIPFGAFLLASYLWIFPRFVGFSLVSALGILLVLMALWSQSYFIMTPIGMALIVSNFAFARRDVRVVSDGVP